MANLRIIGVLAALGTVGFTFAIGAYPPSAHAQTQGMDRRDDRQGALTHSADGRTGHPGEIEQLVRLERL